MSYYFIFYLIMNLFDTCMHYNDCFSFIGTILIMPFTLTWVGIQNLSLPRYQYFLWIIVIFFFLLYMIERHITKDKKLLTWWSIWIFWFWISIWIWDMVWYHHWFPLQARDYPSCWACWSDSPEFFTLLSSVINLIIWYIIGIIISYSYKYNPSQKISKVLMIITTIWIIFLGFWYLSLAFD